MASAPFTYTSKSRWTGTFSREKIAEQETAERVVEYVAADISPYPLAPCKRHSPGKAVLPLAIQPGPGGWALYTLVFGP